MTTHSKSYNPAGTRWHEDMVCAPSVRSGDLLFIAAQVALDRDGRILGPGDAEKQTRVALTYVRDIVAAAGGSLDDIVEIVSYHKDPRDIGACLEVAAEYFRDEYPAWTPTGFIGSFLSEALVAIKAVAHLGPGPKVCVLPESQAWRRRFPMSAACRKGDLVFIAGQSAAPSASTAEGPALHVPQARAAYGEMLTALEMAGGGKEDILDFSSFHEDIRGAERTLLEVYVPQLMAGVTTDQAATTSHIGSTGLIGTGVLGTYRALADLTPGPRQAVTPDTIWWKGVYPIAGGTRKKAGRVITIAGQVSCDPDGSVHAPGDPRAQAEYIMNCLDEVLRGFGASMSDVVEVSSFHKDIRHLPVVMDVARKYFEEHRPAWSPVGVPGLWMEGYLHEISAVAVVEGSR